MMQPNRRHAARRPRRVAPQRILTFDRGHRRPLPGDHESRLPPGRLIDPIRQRPDGARCGASAHPWPVASAIYCTGRANQRIRAATRPTERIIYPGGTHARAIQFAGVELRDRGALVRLNEQRPDQAAEQIGAGLLIQPDTAHRPAAAAATARRAADRTGTRDPIPPQQPSWRFGPTPGAGPNRCSSCTNSSSSGAPARRSSASPRAA